MPWFGSKIIFHSSIMENDTIVTGTIIYVLSLNAERHVTLTCLSNPLSCTYLLNGITQMNSNNSTCPLRTVGFVRLKYDLRNA